MDNFLLFILLVSLMGFFASLFLDDVSEVIKKWLNIIFMFLVIVSLAALMAWYGGY